MRRLLRYSVSPLTLLAALLSAYLSMVMMAGKANKRCFSLVRLIVGPRLIQTALIAENKGGGDGVIRTRSDSARSV